MESFVIPVIKNMSNDETFNYLYDIMICARNIILNIMIFRQVNWSWLIGQLLDYVPKFYCVFV